MKSITCLKKSCGSVDARKEKWHNRIIAIVLFCAWTYFAMHIGAYIERHGLEEEMNLFLSQYAQKMEELKKKEDALIYAVKELKKRRI
jgi:hypothetical protein